MALKRKMHRSFDLSHIGAAPWLCGVDEAGRGCLAGPVVAGAVLVERAFYDGAWCDKMACEIDDSKKLSPEARAKIFAALPDLIAEGTAYFATGLADAREIDEVNILNATKLAMRRALDEIAKMATSCAKLPLKSDIGGLFQTDDAGKAAIIVDGLPLKSFPYEHTAHVGGDGKSLAIGLASIIAKVTRDRLITAIGEKYPEYGFAQHKGYGTEQHRAALEKFGPCPLHRRTFLVKLLGEGTNTRDNQNAFDFAQTQTMPQG